MTIYDQMIEIFEGKEGKILTATEIKSRLINKYGSNRSSILPADYCYNRKNKTEAWKPLLVRLGYNEYKYMGENYPYTGKVYHKPQGSNKEIIVGEWIAGKYQEVEQQKALVLTWTEEAWPHEEIKRMYEEFKKNGEVSERWRVRTFSIAYAGMPVILYKQGEKYRGVFGVGYINSDASEPKHTDDGRILPHRIFDIVFTDFSDPIDDPLLPDSLVSPILGYAKSTRFSGSPIPIEMYDAIQEEILKRKNTDKTFNSYVVSPPESVLGTTSNEPKRKTRKGSYDPGRDRENKKLGDRGEEFIYLLEKDKLKKSNHYGLSEKVRWISRDEGDGFGYDIASYDENGKEIFIEVKTTKGNISTPFFMSLNEVETSKELGACYRIYRVYNFIEDPKFFILSGSIYECTGIELKPTEFKIIV